MLLLYPCFLFSILLLFCSIFHSSHANKTYIHADIFQWPFPLSLLVQRFIDLKKNLTAYHVESSFYLLKHLSPTSFIFFQILSIFLDQ